VRCGEKEDYRHTERRERENVGKCRGCQVSIDLRTSSTNIHTVELDALTACKRHLFSCFAIKERFLPL
jgi:hypothetical protein